MRLTLMSMLPVLLIMVLPKAVQVAVAADGVWPVTLSSHPAWLSIEPPMLIMLGCILVFLAIWVRKVQRKHYFED